MTLETVLGIAGVVALLIGLSGGGITIKELKVPKISSLVRVLSGILGMMFIGIAV